MNQKRVIIAGYIGMFFFGAVFIVMGAVLPSLSEKFSLSTAESSILVGLLPLGNLLGSLLFGPTIDRYGYKSLMIVATIIGAMGLEILAFGESISIIRLGVFFLGTGGGMLNGATNALVADASDSRSKAANLSLLGFFYCIGAFSIPFLLASLSRSFDYTHIVAVAGVIFFITVFYYALVKFPEAKMKQGIPLKKILSMAKEPTLIILSFTLFFQSALEGLAQNWTPKYLEEISGIRVDQAQYALGFIVVGMGISRLLLSFLLKTFKHNVVIALSMTVACTGILIVTFSSSLAITILGSIIFGMGTASTFPVVLGKVGEIYPQMSGTAFSFALVIALIGNTLMNLLVGQTGLNSLPALIIVCMIGIVVLFSIGYAKSAKIINNQEH